MGEKKNWLGNLEESMFCRPRHRWKVNSEMDHKQDGGGGNGLDSSGTGQAQVAGSGGFLDYMSNC
jgi:hypothetical protein